MTDIGTFREENIPLQIEEAKLETEHSTITGAMTVEFEESVSRPETPESSHILGEADRALYHSKDDGRNRFTHVADLPLPTDEGP